jgi:hypothetical protein
MYPSSGGATRKWRYPKLAGWFLKWKIAEKVTDDDWGYPYFQKPRNVWLLVIQGGAPKIAKLVYNSNNYGL